MSSTMISDRIDAVLKRFDYVPVNLKNLFEQTKKADLLKYCRTLTIRSEELAAMAFSSHKIGYLHKIKTFEYIPEHLKILPGERLSDDLKPGQKLTGKDLAFLNKIKGTFAQRRYSVAHLFIGHDKWHIFYFDFHDIDDQEWKHWKEGSHIHFVNYLWANLNVDEVWENLAGRSNKSYGIHIKWWDERISRKHRE